MVEGDQPSPSAGNQAAPSAGGGQGEVAFTPLRVDPDRQDEFIRQWEKIRHDTADDERYAHEMMEARPLASDVESSGMYTGALQQSADDYDKHIRRTLAYIDTHIANLKATNQSYRAMERENVEHIHRAGGGE
jgi:hypothetical protein